MLLVDFLRVFGSFLLTVLVVSSHSLRINASFFEQFVSMEALVTHVLLINIYSVAIANHSALNVNLV